MHKASSLTWEEFASKATESIAILPVGSLEQHRPHLPLGTDTTIAIGIAHKVAQAVDAVVLPPIAYGYRSNPFSGGGPLFPGTVDLSATTLMDLVENILLELASDGFSQILIMNAHFENQTPIYEAMVRVSEAHGDSVTIVQTNWWDPLSDDLIEEVFSDSTFPGWALEHGAVTETSLMLYLAPEDVRVEKYPNCGDFTPPPYLRVPSKQSDIPSHGALADASYATAEKGKMITDSAVRGIIEICRIEF